MSGINYRLEIDGLRAIAVVPVILFHLGLDQIPGGFIGVDVFFVISGFLITSIIIQELEEGTFSFRGFWTRRIRRILPAMIVVSASTLTVTYLFVFRPDQQMIAKQALAALFSVANVYFWRTTGDYWATSSEESPFLHAWSLSVEEQFYLLFPIGTWFIYRFRPQWVQACIATATVASLALFLWGSQADPTATFYLLPTRVWELGSGCLLAATLRNQVAKNCDLGVLASLGLGMIASSYLFVDTLNIGVALAVFGTCLIIAFGQNGLCYRLLTQRFFIHIGKLSYSLYLWHWPVLVLAEHCEFDWAGSSDKVLLLVAIYLLSLATYFFVEKPTRKRTEIIPRIIFAGATVAFFAFMLAVTPQSYNLAFVEAPRFVEHDFRRSAARQSVGLFLHTETENVTSESPTNEGIRVGGNDQPPEILVFGDSHGNMWSKAIADAVRELSIPTAFFVVGGGENPFFEIPPTGQTSGRGFKTVEDKLYFENAKLRAIEKWKPKLVIVSANWNEIHKQTARDLLTKLNNSGCQTLLIEDPPRLKIRNNINVVQYLCWKGLVQKNASPESKVVIPSDSLAENEGKRQIVRMLLQNHSNVKLLPTYDLYQSGKGATVLIGKTPLYLDDDHLTSQGAMLITRRLKTAIQDVFRDHAIAN